MSSLEAVVRKMYFDRFTKERRGKRLNIDIKFGDKINIAI